MSIERDLERWESGALSGDDLRRLHPEDEIGELLALYERMSALGTEAEPLDEVALQRFLKTLPDHARPRRRGRSLLLAVAAVLLTASMAAAVPGIRYGVTAVTDGIGGFLGVGSPPSTGPAPAGPSAAPPTSDTTGDDEGSGDATDPAADDQGVDGGQDEGDGDHAGGGSGGGDSEGSGEGDQGQDTSGDQGEDTQGDGGGSSSEGTHDGGGGGGSGSGDEDGDGDGGGSGTSSGSTADQDGQ